MLEKPDFNPFPSMFRSNHTPVQEILMQLYTTTALLSLDNALFNLSLRFFLEGIETKAISPIISTSFLVGIYMGINIYNDVKLAKLVMDRVTKMDQQIFKDHVQFWDDYACFTCFLSIPLSQTNKIVQNIYKMSLNIGNQKIAGKLFVFHILLSSFLIFFF